MGTTSLTRSSTPYSGWDTTIPSMESIKDMDTRSMDTMVMGVGLMVEATEVTDTVAATAVMVMEAATTVADPTTTSIMDTLESTTTVTANATGTRAMATTSMTMTEQCGPQVSRHDSTENSRG